MRKTLLVPLLLIITLLAAPLIAAHPSAAKAAPFTAEAAPAGSAPAQEAPPVAPAPSPQALCLPGIYMSSPADCAPTGPSAYLTEMAKKGITFPLSEVPARAPDPALSQIYTNYGMVNKNPAPVYASVDDAMGNKKKNASRMMAGEFVYISYTDATEIDGKRFYMIEPGSWMTANDVSRIGAIPMFQGVELTRTPEIPFGWVLSYFAPEPVQTKRTPGYEVSDYTGHVLNLLEIVQVYAEEQVGDTAWYMVGPDEWVPQEYIARVIPNTTPPEGVPGDRWIEVNLFEQTLSVYDQRQLVFATIVATGTEGFWTRPGAFQIYQKLETTYMTGASEADRSDAYYLEDVPYTMYYDDARALHGAYWRAKLGYPQSHGCVNMTVGDSHWVFNWAQEGDWVYVWDPSGQTPTDPNLYTGGAY